jgi:hypothetical protein
MLDQVLIIRARPSLHGFKCADYVQKRDLKSQVSSSGLRVQTSYRRLNRCKWIEKRAVKEVGVKAVMPARNFQ